MQGSVAKDASGGFRRSAHPKRPKVWLGEHEKSTEKNSSHTSRRRSLASCRCSGLPVFRPRSPLPPQFPKSRRTYPLSLPANPQDLQTPPAQNPSDSQTTLKVTWNYVFLPVTVKDGAGRLVPDLTRNEFRVLDDSVEQRIEFFSAEAFPLSVVVLLDNDLKSKDAEQVESSLSAIVAGLSRQRRSLRLPLRFEFSSRQRLHPRSGQAAH